MLTFQIIISQIAGPEIMFFLCVVVACFLYFQNHRKDFFKIFFASTTAMFIALIAKYLFHIARPAHMLVAETGYGFPSGHATMAGVVMTLGIAYAHTHIKRKHIQYGIYGISVLWLVLVGYSRLYLQVHYPIDVIAGGIIGILSTITVLKIFKHFHYYK